MARAPNFREIAKMPMDCPRPLGRDGQSQIRNPNLKCGAACVREHRPRFFTEGLAVGYAEMIGKRQLFTGW